MLMFKSTLLAKIFKKEKLPTKQEKYNSLKKQRKNISAYYDKVSLEYDESLALRFSFKAEYQLPRLLVDTFSRFGINNGIILDIGCGTGKIKDNLGGSFQYTGIDLSEKMLEQALSRGYTVHLGAVEENIKSFPDKSIDHIIALSSFYFIKNIENLIAECERVARKSVFISLEQFSDETKKILNEENGVEVYNHSQTSLPQATEIRKVKMWRRLTTGEQIYGYLVFKKLEG